MTKKDSWLSPQELQLIEPLRRGPELMERFETILQISANAEGPVKSADEVEGLLIREMRLLGNATMGSWAAGAEKHLGEQWRQKDVSARARKKKTLKWRCVFGRVSVREQVWRTGGKKASGTL